MHHIQVKILDKLNHYEFLRFADLRVDKIESNLFTYHLKQLIKDGYIEKIDGKYTLSPQGIFHVDRFSARLGSLRMQPKIVTMIDIRDEHNQSLVVRRKYQPFIGKVSYPSGKLHLGETVAEAGVRELIEKTGVDNVAIEHVGDVYVLVYKDSQMVGHYLMHMLLGHTEQHKVDLSHYQKTNRWAEPFWGDISNMASDEGMPGLHDIKQAIDTNNSHFFCEFRYDL